MLHGSSDQEARMEKHNNVRLVCQCHVNGLPLKYLFKYTSQLSLMTRRIVIRNRGWSKPFHFFLTFSSYHTLHNRGYDGILRFPVAKWSIVCTSM